MLWHACRSSVVGCLTQALARLENPVDDNLVLKLDKKIKQEKYWREKTDNQVKHVLPKPGHSCLAQAVMTKKFLRSKGVHSSVRQLEELSIHKPTIASAHPSLQHAQKMLNKHIRELEKSLIITYVL